MDAKTIREMTDEEIGEELERTRKELFNLKFRATYEELENPALLSRLRRDIARLETIRRERELKKEAEGR